MTAAAEPGLLALLGAGLLLLAVNPFRALLREPNIGFNALICSGRL